MGFVFNSLCMMSWCFEMVWVFVVFVGMVQGGGQIELVLQQFVVYVVSMVVGCLYCQVYIGVVVQWCGVDVEFVVKVWEFEMLDVFDDWQCVVLCFVCDVVVVLNVVIFQYFEELCLYFDEGQIVDFVGVILFFGFFNCWNDIFVMYFEDELREFGEQIFGVWGWIVGKYE